ncbi:N-6 DNA methylase [Parvibaculum sp.]|uniref:Eco57I restriction-modification methylase domain-containing protein n=1 Tax=Parvibaculum sp. TaxID=2024848 RepID=UPI001B1F7D36|nr:N-6 DNA methylase [Parvibaculum sp.]MBO6633059.1 N-6 DNA methylase [Parvibaculum sp.]MBO6677341.1 N-6 DNA methylase [Parvibaculum sp.]MBO6686504.1 N-6 DNA methylase [Parvibaculum sp.]
MSQIERAPDRYSSVAEKKSTGATYTPTRLAEFVADRMLAHARFIDGQRLRLLDPSVGHGELLVALVQRLGRPVTVYGFDTDPVALEIARQRMEKHCPEVECKFVVGSFLDHVLSDFLGGLFGTEQRYDLVIANPPYVRTQIIGTEQSRRLATQFGLAGRVDLYHAFLLGMARVLAPEGIAGFIVSNRFMTTKGGASARSGLMNDLNLREIYDLGDTKLFDAAVLPAVIIATGQATESSTPAFSTIYQAKREAASNATDPIDALSSNGFVGVPDGRTFEVKHGKLDVSGDASSIWRLASDQLEDWLSTVAQNTWGQFKDIGKVRVGVKTCADKVFLPKEWDDDLELHRPLTTHHTARRFRPMPPNRKILYPHEAADRGKRAVELDRFPKSKAYLERHRATLEARSYVIEAGREWYEIWVPQNPSEWPMPKLVFRDISERPTFWMDLDGTVVNGDCYWLTGDPSLLWLALAVANSTFIEHYYDNRFNNKLYAGRRRFITQYVEQFPLPDPNRAVSKEIVDACRALYSALVEGPQPDKEKELDAMVWGAFGLSVEEI